MRPVILVVGAVALLQAGCTSFSGLSGSSSYSCKAPEGVACDSVAGTYANAVQNNLPSQRSRATPRPGPNGSPTPLPAGAASEGSLHAPPEAAHSTSLPPTPVALRSAPRVLRLWFKPWEDADHDLYDQGYVYVQVDGGRWQIEHVQRQIREFYAPLKAPPRSTASADASSVPTGARVGAQVAPRPAISPLLPGMPRIPGRDARADVPPVVRPDDGND
jgi:conjugal transfer pilus assembly protein TraV